MTHPAVAEAGGPPVEDELTGSPKRSLTQCHTIKDLTARLLAVQQLLRVPLGDILRCRMRSALAKTGRFGGYWPQGGLLKLLLAEKL